MRRFGIHAFLIALCTLAGCNTGVIDSTVPPEDPSQKEEKVKPAEWATVYGVVSCEGKGIKGAVVSDGCKVVLTDGNGVYNIASEKRLKYVFISIPSGYEVASDGVLPRMSVRLTKDKAEFTRTAGEYAKPSTANEILINVWDYDPSWKISVTENGRELSVTQVKGARDPLYLLAYEAYEYDNGWDISYPSSTFDHMFKATASSPSSTVEVKVTDRYGRVFTERVARPRPFEPGTYLP